MKMINEEYKELDGIYSEIIKGLKVEVEYMLKMGEIGFVRMFVELNNVKEFWGFVFGEYFDDGDLVWGDSVLIKEVNVKLEDYDLECKGEYLDNEMKDNIFRMVSNGEVVKVCFKYNGEVGDVRLESVDDYYEFCNGYIGNGVEFEILDYG